MGRYSFRVIKTSSAPREKVWALVSNGAGWKDWAGVLRSSLEREGQPPPDGVGSIRRLGIPPLGSREEVVEWDPPSHLGYVILSGMPVRNYRADIRLEDRVAGDGVSKMTIIDWSATFDPMVPGTGAVVRASLRAVIAHFAQRAARQANRASDSVG
jgi:Polyketide cyclase / dehydrase and lipid transport